MVIRSGFVSNSSSSSFLVDFNRDVSKFSDFVEAFKDKLPEAISKINSKYGWDEDEEIGEAELLYILYSLYKEGEKYKDEEIKYRTEKQDHDYLNKANTIEEITDEPSNNLGYFTFNSEYREDTLISNISAIIEGYGIGSDIFKDFKYIMIDCH